MILVTGGTGLLGSHLLFDLANQGKQVRAIKRCTGAPEAVLKLFRFYSPKGDILFKQIEWFDGDILDVFSLEEAMHGVSKVYHCAAMVSFQKKDRDQMMKVNACGTANVMNTALEMNIEKVCHVSSIAALGRQAASGIIDEESRWKDAPGNSNYSISKYAAEREAWRTVEEGLNVVIVNPSIIIGPGNWDKGSSQMFSKAAKGIKYYSDGVSGFVDVRDVTACMIKLMDSNYSKDRFILNSENVPYKTFFDKIHDELGTRRPYIKAGKFLTELAWRVDTITSFLLGKNPMITKESARSAHNVHYFSNEKIRKAINHDFITSTQMVKDTCKCFKKWNEQN